MPALARGRPGAPPAYRPQPVPRVLQTKPAQLKAPPVYRPQAVPRVLQAKAASHPSINKRTPAGPSVRPAVPFGNARPVVQLYSIKQVPALKANVKVSTNEHYIVWYDDVMYIRQGATVPRGFVNDRQVLPPQFDYNHATYYAYSYAGLFLKDCLHTAEELINQRELEFNTQTSSRVKGIGRVFGQPGDKNVKYAKREQEKGLNPVNEAANPAVNEAYAIVNTGQPSEWPYHAAAVVAKDGNDTVTLEVCATSEDAKRRNTKGNLRMYEIGGDKSFHAEHKGAFDQPITIVIVPK